MLASHLQLGPSDIARKSSNNAGYQFLISSIRAARITHLSALAFHTQITPHCLYIKRHGTLLWLIAGHTKLPAFSTDSQGYKRKCSSLESLTTEVQTGMDTRAVRAQIHTNKELVIQALQRGHSNLHTADGADAECNCSITSVYGLN